MALNNQKALGDDQAWKQEVEKEIKELIAAVSTLQSNLNSLFKRVNGS